jgi:uncharacterized cupin superfamily protein
VTEPFNLFSDDWDREQDRDGYRHRTTAIGKRLGAEVLGASTYELPPGERTFPYHWELGCEEWLLCIFGRPTLRDPDGERELAPGDVVCFPEGRRGAHQVRNDSGEPARVLVFSTKTRVAVAGYPDSDKLLVHAPGELEVMLRDNPPLDYWDRE